MVKRFRYAGFAKEAGYGQAAAAAAFHVDITSATLDTPTDSEIVYEGGIGRSAKVKRPGYYSPAGNIVYGIDINTIIYFLKWALGGYKFTAGTPNKHEFWGSDNSLLDSFTAFVGKDVFEHRFAGCVINSLELVIEGGFVVATVAINAKKDAKRTLLSEEDLILTEEYPLVFHEVTASVGGSDVSADVKRLTLSINNNTDVAAGRGLGSRHPQRIPVNNRETTFSLNLWFGDGDQLQRFWGSETGPSEDGGEEFPTTIKFDTGDGKEMEIKIPRAFYTQVQTQASGRDELVQECSARALRSTVTLADGTTEVDSEIYAAVDNTEGGL